MKNIMLAGSCLMLIAAALVLVVQIKEKGRITDPFLILAIITFFVSFRMIFKIAGI